MMKNVLKKFLLVFSFLTLSASPQLLATQIETPEKMFMEACSYPIPTGWTYINGQSYFGRNNYIEYIPGTLPIIITAPHGGYLAPSEIPPLADTLERDGGSQEYARLVSDKIFNMTGKRPHLIINHLTRHRLQANSSKDIATNGNIYAGQAWEEFHAYIENAKTFVKGTCLRGLLLDFHTNGHTEGWVELGFGLTKSNLDLSSSSLNNSTYIDKATFRSLSMQPNQSFIELIRGTTGLGGFLSAKGIKVVPSPLYPGPNGGNYFDGGYNVRTHGSQQGGPIDAIQIESHYNYVNSGATKRNIYSQSLAEAILSFVDTNYRRPIKIISRINKGSDDAEELRQGTIGKMSITSTNIDLVKDTYNQMIGLRFNNLNLPANAIIESAHIQFRSAVTGSTTTNLTIMIENKINPITYASTLSNISNRKYSSLQVAWNIPAWKEAGVMEPAQLTPNLKPLIQDLISKIADQSKVIDSLAFSFSGSGRRVANSFEGYASKAPQISIIYSLPLSSEGTLEEKEEND